jgi:hypothetical protein
LPDRYDDGGYSGGSLERQALKRLVEDVEGGTANVIVVYKHGRRHRYYVSQLALHGSAEPSPKPTRLPAHEVECRVAERFAAFLKSDAELFDAVSAPWERPAVVRPLLSAARKLAAKCVSALALESRKLSVPLLRNIIVHDDGIEVLVGRTELRQRLGGEKFMVLE